MSMSVRWPLRTSIALGSVLSLGIAACPGKGDSGEPATCDRDPPLSYENFGEGFMGLHCVGCHSELYPEYLRSGAPLDINFNTYFDVVQQVERIEARGSRLFGDPTMPPSGGPTEEELVLFEEWLECSVWPDHDALAEQGEL